jgi:multidrug efflux pump subunit AcrB
MKKAGKKPQNEAADPCWTGYKQIGMKKKNGKEVPNCVPTKEEYTGSDPKSNDSNNPLSRMDGTYSGAKVYADKTPGQKLAHKSNSTLKIIKKVIKEDAITDSDRLTKFKKDLADAAAEQKLNTVKTSIGGEEPTPITQQPAKFADRKAAASKQTPDGVKKPDINGDIQRNINSRLAPVLGGLKQKMDGKFRQNSISRMSEENISEVVVRDITGKKNSLNNVKFRGSDNKIHSAPPAPSGSHGGGDE